MHSLRFGSRIWKVNIDQNSNPFFHLFQRNPVIHDLISQENVFSFGIYSNKNMKLGSEKFYVSWLPITVFATTWIENNVWKYMNIIFVHCGEEMRYKRSHSYEHNWTISWKETWKKFRSVRDLNQLPLRYRCSARRTELTSVLRAGLYVGHIWKSYMLHIHDFHIFPGIIHRLEGLFGSNIVTNS